MIRQVQTEDWELLRDVRLRALKKDPDAFLATFAGESQFTDDQWRERATPNDEGTSFVVVEDAHTEGLVSCFGADDPGTVFLVAMWVAPTLRGTGVARELVASVVDWARARGSKRVCLSVEARNDRAARLYEKCGFAETFDPPPFPYEPNAGNHFFVCEL